MISKRLINNVGIYFIGIFFTKILQFLFIPIYSIYLSPEEFGYFNLVITIIALCVPLFYQSIWEGVLRFIIEKRLNKEKILITVLIYCLLLSILYVLIFVLINNIAGFSYAIFVLLVALSQVGLSYWQFSSRALSMNKVYSLSSILHAIVTITVNLILIIQFEWGILALFVANILANVISLVYLEKNVSIYKYLKKSNIDFLLLKPLIKYSFPLSINAASWWLLMSFSIVLVTYWINLEEAGIYSMASRFGTIMTLITSVISLAWLEESFKTVNDKDSHHQFNKVLHYITKLNLSFVALLIPLTYIFYNYFVFGDFFNGVTIVPIVYLTAAFAALGTHLASIFLANKESFTALATTFLGGIIAVISGLFLVDPLGSLGVALSSLIGFIVMYVIRIPLLKKRISIEIDYKLLVFLTLFCFLITVICDYNRDSLAAQIITTFLVFISLIFINYKEIVFLKSKLVNKFF